MDARGAGGYKGATHSNPGSPMALAAIALLVLSAVTHALWNLASTQEPSPAFFMVVNTLGTLCFTPVLFFTAGALPYFPPSVWGLIVLTGLFQTGYYVALAGAYRGGQMSVSYPIARASSILFVALLNSLLRSTGRPGPAALAGMALISLGILLLPLESLRRFHWKTYLTRGALLALAAALGTAGYSICDDRALRILRGIPGLPGGITGATILYSWVEGISTSVFVTLLVLLLRPERQRLPRLLQRRVGLATATGAIIFFSYALVLFAMNMVRDVSYVVAFRQLSVPIGAALGILVLKEPIRGPKLAGAAITTAGLVLVALG
jgi:drug/metabolite transporter (DMT)-like permease